MQRVLDFGFRYRLSPLVKGLLAFPCMQPASLPMVCPEASEREAAFAPIAPHRRLSAAHTSALLDFLAVQKDKLRGEPGRGGSVCR